MSDSSPSLQPHNGISSDQAIDAKPEAITIRARGRSFLALILSPEAPLESWLRGLDAQMVRSAGFFNRQPIILDLSLLQPDAEGLAHFQDELKKRGIRLIGVEGGNRDWPALQNWDWPGKLSGGRPRGNVSLPEDSPDSVPPQEHTAALKDPLVVNGPVRSGQSVQNPDGDVIILGAVSSGAEIIAGGSIHVYGPLRGRAIAGVDGRPQSRIFTTRMEAELLAIDGFYMVSDEISSEWHGLPTQTILEEEKLVVHPFT
ncbi:septum formation inhibitor MinC [Saccharibacter sp. 17.LH.SD]|uniref:septum site-determining protein MinC n=1 Tax=Saccharibacter sp. 17.LH.SD TaxID=2689393 RepID=UPI00136D4ECF|nr:septum site-determining protein MinC [Saccharibacter sp. 17.LH.SD]MXV44855.1 septum formation inhibitor MinC [Saccharibacter sp. 17.LH.SD]